MSEGALMWANTCPFCGQQRRILLADMTLAKTCPVCGKPMPAHPIDTHGWLETTSFGTKKPPREQGL